MSRVPPILSCLCFLLLAVLIASCSGPQAASKPSQSPSQPGDPTSAPALSSTSVPAVGLPITAQGQTIQIDIADDAFQPSDITIPIGYTVIWINTGKHPHTVTADNGSFASQPLHTGDVFQHTFNTPGSYDYFCEFHGEAGRKGMFGTITVATGSTPVAQVTRLDH